MTKIYSNHQLRGGIDVFGIDNTRLLQPKKLDGFGYSKEELAKIMDYEKKKSIENTVKETTASKSKCDFAIEELEDRYVISPIKYHDGLYEVSWSRELLDSGNNYNKDEWIENLKDSEWCLPSGPLYYATLKALYQNKDGNNKELIKKLRTSFKEDFVKHI